MNTLLKRFLFTFSFFVFLLMSVRLYSQTTPTWNAELTPNGANSLVFRFTKQVWLNPTIILARKEFEASTHVKLLLIPRINNNDTSSNSKLENAFDKVFALLYSDETTGSIKFYFNSQNTAKPFTFATSEELWCKFTPAQKDTVEQLLNKLVATNNNLSDFSKLPFESVINQASRYCKQVLLRNNKPCGDNPQQVFSSININSTPAKLNFEQAPFSTQPTGDVDEQQYDALKAYYNSATDSVDDSNYPIAWKAMSSSNDVIKLKLKKNSANFNLAEVKFKNSGGTETYTTQISPTDNTLLNISISGKPAGTMAEVVAYYTAPSNPEVAATTYPIGAFNVQFYQSKPALKLVLVNLGNAQMPDINKVQEELTKIYGSIFIKWDVSIIKHDLPNNLSKNLTIENSRLLSNYPPSMQPIIKDFKSKNNVDANAYYLFLGCSNNNDLLGYMPRARNIGFIFDNSPHTIAHELGHGAFNLKHIFSSDELGEGNRGQTDNLMDYAPVNGGTTKPQEALYKYQWDLIHNPSFVGWFEGDDEEGASKAIVGGKWVVSVSGNSISDGQILIYNGASTKMNIKLENSGISKQEVDYQLIITIESSKEKITYPTAGYDKVVYNVEKEITLDAFPQGKYTLICKVGNVEYQKTFHIRKEKLEITTGQLQSIFPATDAARIAEVTKLINQYAEAFGLTTPDRMANFIGQIGAETGDLKNLKESAAYSARGIVNTFPYPKYGHLFEEAQLDPTTYTYSYKVINFDENRCVGEQTAIGTAVFSYKSQDEIRNAYAEIKKDSLEVLLNGKRNKILVYKNRTDVTAKNLTDKVTDKNYNSGRLRIKSIYLKSASLFDVAYACRMGNSTIASKEGSTFLGKGFIHITGKAGYKEISDEWNRIYPEERKEFHGKDINLLETNVEVALKASMVFWKLKNLNKAADEGTDGETIETIGKAVNGGANGLPDRKKYTESASDNIK